MSLADSNAPEDSVTHPSATAAQSDHQTLNQPNVIQDLASPGKHWDTVIVWNKENEPELDRIPFLFCKDYLVSSHEQLFETLFQKTPWQSRSCVLNGKEFPEPRRSFAYGLHTHAPV